jgi:anaphase-promoting complex subunit 4
MDLVALTTEDGQVHVFRLNGQRVFAASYEEEPGNIKGLKWKPNGKLYSWNLENKEHIDVELGQTLAVACTDNVVRLISVFSGKTIHQLPAVCQTSTAHISSLSWAVNFTNSHATQQQLNDVGEDVSLDDLLGLNAQMPTLLKSKPDLPREFALVDVETSLPKLSTLPIFGGE